MTIAAKPEEMRRGKPGQRCQEFRLEITSRSDPDKVYVIAQEHTGTLYHVPVCPAWLYHGHCWHVARAVALTTEPLRTLFTDLAEAKGTVLSASITEEQLETWARQVDERVRVALEAFVTRRRYLAREDLVAQGKKPMEDIWREYADGPG